MRQPTTKWQKFGTSIFTEMTQLAMRHNAINLAQGFPSFDGPDEIKDAAIDAIRNAKNQYAPSAGVPELRSLLAARRKSCTGIEYNPDSEVTVFSGATEAIFCSFLGLFDRDDEVITFTPWYDSYPASAVAAGVQLKGVPLDIANGTIDRDKVAASISDRTRAILINSPHNPTGIVLSRSDLAFIAGLAQDHDLLVITDEVYEELVFGDSVHLSMSQIEGMRERTIVISSTSKTFSFTGWKIGYTFAPPMLTNQLRAVHQFSTFCSATPLQWGMTAALKLSPDYYEQLRKDYEGRMHCLLQVLAENDFTAQAPQGTYFVLARYDKWSSLGDLDFCRWLIENAGVAAIPISGFYPIEQEPQHNYIRFGFCKDVETILKAGERLKTSNRP